MLPRARLERIGDVFFRFRGVLPLVALAELPLAFSGGEAPTRLGVGLGVGFGVGYEIACIAVGLLGLALRFSVVGSVARGTSGRNQRRQRAHSLNTTGAYSIVRNPLYVANFLCWMSVSMLLRHLPLIAANALLFFAFYRLIIFREEAFLEETFGERYREFASRVPRLLPKPWLWTPPTQPFSLRRALRREHDSLLSLVGALAAVDLTYHVLAPGAGPWEALWPVLLVLTAVAWAVLKLAKKRTAWLEPRGEVSAG